jgi:hypothetical protein
LWLFPKIKSLLKGLCDGIEDIKECDVGTESYSTTGVPKMFLSLVAS